MRLLLTDGFCDRAKSDGQTDYFDETVSGLALRVTKHGVKAWTFIYTSSAGKRARMTLGRYPEVGLAAARTRASGRNSRRIFAGTSARSGSGPSVPSV
jgi:Arm DNA-binding domain